jgi:hypothetical protein
LARLEFESGTILIVLLLSLVSFEESHLFISCCAAWRAATRIIVGVGDPVKRTDYSRTCWVFGGRAIGRSGDAVCGPHRA